MRKRLWVTLPLCLLAGAAFAAVSVGTAAGGTARATINPTLNIAVDNTDVDHSDPALSYSVLGWQMEQETCDTLVGYTDHSGSVSNSVGPLGAAGMPVVSNGGKKYVFTIASGRHFSNGDAITAASYKYAFDRDALHALNSPVTAFMSAVKGWTTENNSSSIKSVSGVTASGNKLTIVLTKADGTLLPKLAMPFFCPLTKNSGLWTGSKWNDDNHGYTGAFPGSGPYYLYSRNVGSQMVLKKNTHYSGKKLSKASTIVMNMNLSTNTAYNGISNGTYASDANGNPEPANNHSLFNSYGKNKSRFWVESTMIISYTVMNEARSAFQPSHVKLRQAWNDVIDRPGALQISGYLSGSAQTQALPKALAGSHFSAAYKYPITTPNTARFNAAKTLGGNCANHAHINFWHGSSSPALLNASLIKTNLTKIGCNVTDTAYDGYDRYTAAGVKGNAMDIMTAGWSDDYPDAYDWFGILFNGRTITSNNNNDLAYLKNSTINSKTDACNKLTGSARVNCWGALDQYQTDKVAAWGTLSATNFVDYIAGNAHNYKYDGPFASAELGLLYQS
jgi:ABC-type oligopeptide transport system substrate-binding subunit